MSYLSSNPHGRKPFFQAKDVPLWGKFKFHQIVFFHKTWVEKGPPPDQENHLRLKNFFIREYLWNVSFTIQVVRKL